MARVRMLVEHTFTHEDRAPIRLHPGDFFFLDDERAVEWLRMGLCQTEDAPYPPAPPPTLLDAAGHPIRRDTCSSSA